MYAQFVLLILFSTLTLTVSVSFATSVDDAHSIVTNKMLQSAQNAAMGVSNAPPINGTTIQPLYIPIVFSAVDNDSLVVGIDIQELVNGNNYTEQDVRDYLDVDVPLEIVYMGFDHISKNDPITITMIDDDMMMEVKSPKKQMENNVKPMHVFCSSDKELAFKVSDNSAVCLTPTTTEILIKRGIVTQ